MFIYLKRDWVIYFYSGLLALIVSWTLGMISGCRWGNHVEKAANPDPISGYYETQPQTLQYCASSPKETCKALPTNQLPALMAEVITDPVGFVVGDQASGNATIINAFEKQNPAGLAVELNKDFSISNAGHKTIKLDSNCVMHHFMEISGNLSQNPTTSIKVISGASFRIMGRLALFVRMSQSFEGQCDTVMNLMNMCYEDPSYCWGGGAAANSQAHQEVLSIFDPYVMAGVLDSKAIAGATDLGFEISYE